MGGSRGGGGWMAPLVEVHKKKVEERDNLRAIQHAGSAKERERIEAKQQGREAFAGASKGQRWEGYDKGGQRIPEPTPAPKVETKPAATAKTPVTTKSETHASHQQTAYNKKQQLKIDQAKKKIVTSEQLAAPTIKI